MSEWRHIGRQAGTVLIGQLAVVAFGVADTIVAGHFNPAALAALAVGQAIFLTVFVSLQTIVQALLPIYAQYHGAGDPLAVGRAFHQSLYVALLIALTGITVLLHPTPLMDWAGVPADLQPQVKAYLSVLAIAFSPSLLFRMFSTLSQAIGLSRVAAVMQIGALCLKIPLSVWFTFGGLGLAPMGVVGCALASLIVALVCVLAGAWMLARGTMYRPLAAWRMPDLPHPRAIASYLRLGVPAGMASLVEITSFTLMALFVARQGPIATAAHQVAASMAAVLFMMPLSMGIAASARVSYWIGAGEPGAARATALLSLRMILAAAAALALALLALRGPLAALHAAEPAVVALAAGLLGWVALFHVADALQGVCAFVLRSYRVTVRPFLVYVVFLWGLGLAGGYRLAYQGIGPIGPMEHPSPFWIAGGAANACVAVIFVLMLRRYAARASS